MKLPDVKRKEKPQGEYPDVYACNPRTQDVRGRWVSIGHVVRLRSVRAADIQHCLGERHRLEKLRM